MAQLIGYIHKKVVDLLQLTDVQPNSPVYIGETNIAHIRSRHPYEYEKYFQDIATIISEPDYVGINPSDQSISFVKEYRFASEYIRVAVRVTAGGKFYAKSLHLLSSCNTERYIKHGTLKKLDTSLK